MISIKRSLRSSAARIAAALALKFVLAWLNSTCPSIRAKAGPEREPVFSTFRPLLPPAYFGTPAAPMLYVICTTDNFFPAALGV